MADDKLPKVFEEPDLIIDRSESTVDVFIDTETTVYLVPDTADFHTVTVLETDLIIDRVDEIVDVRTDVEEYIYWLPGDVGPAGPAGPKGEKGDSGGGAGLCIPGVFITGVDGLDGYVGVRTYRPSIPANTHLAAITTSAHTLRVHVLSEGGTGGYTPAITVNGTPVGFIEETTTLRVFRAYADIAVPVDGIITAESSGGSDRIMVTLDRSQPLVAEVSFGLFPGIQTSLKQFDLVAITAIVSNDAEQVLVLAGATSPCSLALSPKDSGGPARRIATGILAVTNLHGDQPVPVIAKNTLGTESVPCYASLPLDQTVPEISAIVVEYPEGQQALKDAEEATFYATITGADTYTYSSSLELQVFGPAFYSPVKTVKRLGGDYTYGKDNLTITATRSSNGATATRRGQVTIANVPPSAIITIDGAGSRLGSSPEGQIYVVRVAPSQRLLTAPIISASKGTLGLAGFNQQGAMFLGLINIRDTDSRGMGVFSIVDMKGPSGISGDTISFGATYDVGGFTNRTITFHPFSQCEPLGVSVSDLSRVSARLTGAGDLFRRTDTIDFFKGFTVTDSMRVFSAKGDHVFLNDAALAGANTTGTLQVDVWET